MTADTTAAMSCHRRALHRLGGHACRAFSLSALLVAAGTAAYPQSFLPNAPAPQPDAIAYSSAMGADPMPQQSFPPQGPRGYGGTLPGLNPSYVPIPRRCRAQACSQATPRRDCCQEQSGLFASYLKHNAAQIYTPERLARLATRSVADPFNLLTIVGTSAYSVAIDSHSPYGPGVMGIARLSGVSLTQDITGEFFGTFLIPSIDHQYPHYVRMPNASIPRRILHCIVQPFWTVTDSGGNVVNYSNLAGTMADEAVDIAYVPYQRVGWGASAARVSTAWATAPIGNFVTEFVPDVARHINLNIVFVQRIIDQVAVEEGGGVPSTVPP